EVTSIMNRSHISTMPTPSSRRPWSSTLALLSTVALLLAGTFGASPAFAQQPQQITFDEAVRIALEQNISLQQAENQSELSSINVSRARMNFFPDLSFSTSTNQNYGRNFSQGEGRIISQSTQSLSLGASAGINIFNGFNDVATLQQARLNREAGELDVDRARQTVVFNVISDYLTLIADREQIKVREQNLASVQRQLEQIQEFTRVGARPISDLYQQQAAVANAELQLLQAQQQYQLAESALIQVLRLDPFQPYQFTAPPVDSLDLAPRRYELDNLLRNAYDQRPDLQASEAGLKAARQGVRAARSSYFPRVGLNFSYGSGWSSVGEDPITRAYMPFWEQLDSRRGGGIGFSLSVPIFDRFTTRNNVQQARVQYENARLERESVRQGIAVQVRQAYLDYQTAQKSVDVARAQVESAQLALNAAQERYDLGAATLLEVAQARTVFVEAQSQQVQARYDLLFREKLIDYYLGALDPRQPLF
ncbi:MAG TPA: TolC family protein, partial [Rhodothermales bacterium]|nr:TolC family protein [Rhodothermales bacterium]